ncbi:MAG: ATP-binding cassette domain-containing protein [Caldilineaceae bacterium]
MDEASFQIDLTKPEIFTIAGESGSGKTTLARMFLGLETPTHGVLRYKGRSVADLSEKDKRNWFSQGSAARLPGPVRRLQPA